MRTSSLVALLGNVAFFGLAGCGSGIGNAGAPMGDMAFLARDLDVTCGGGAKNGPADTHCSGDGAGIATAVDATQCTASGGATTPDYGDTMYGQAGNDDGCKYTVSYKLSPICENRGVTYTVILKSAVDGTPVTGAKTRIELTLDETHKGPDIGQTSAELAPGVYSVGPVEYDGDGTWVTRFHFFDDCADVPGSPRSQAAFFTTVQ